LSRKAQMRKPKCSLGDRFFVANLFPQRAFVLGRNSICTKVD
jgi:hypothetical protein